MKALILLALSFNLFAYPLKLEIYFFTSKDKVSTTASSLQSKLIAKNILKLQCQKMGEYCFDPQVGLYKKGEEDKAVHIKEDQGPDKNLKKVKGLGANGFFNQDLINCDKSKFYDVFCNKGKVKQIQRKESFEVWMDTSSIMKNKDKRTMSKSCMRADFLSLVQSTCAINKGFKTKALSSIQKPLGSIAEICQESSDRINIDKLISWIKKSTARKVHIFLDEYYAQGKLLSFLKTKPAIKVYGIEKTIHLSSMDDEVRKLKTQCN